MKHAKLLKVLFLFFFTGIALSSFGQQFTVKGKVTDASDGTTLPGVTIVVKNTTTGTVTDINGNYSITVPKGSTLAFSFVGYQTQEFVIETSQTLNVALSPTITSLEQILIIGYGQVKKGDATGSVTAVSTEDFNRGSITNPLELMAGKTAGVQIVTNSGAPGSGATIRIRGGSSLSASNDPLIVVDGVPLDNIGISGTRDQLSTINPNDIETFTILKDASAAAIYGNRASNGVIIITTKKGSLTPGKKAPQFEYNGVFSLYTIPQKREVFDGDQFRGIINERYSDRPDVLALLGDANTDWQDEIYRSSFGHDHTVSATGAIGALPYRASVAYANYDGILKTDNMQRTSFGLNLNPSLFDDNLKINLNGKGMFIDQRFANEGAIGSAIQMDPTKPVYDSNAYGGYWTWLRANGTPVDMATDNPVALLEQRHDNADVSRFLGNAQFDYKMPFLPELRANLNLGLDYSKSDGTVYVPGNAAFAFDPQYGGGTNTKYTQEKRNELLDFTLNYVKEVPSIYSKFDIMGGYSWQHFYREDTNSTTNDLNGPFFIQKRIFDTSSNKSEYYLVSFFTRFNYSLFDRYLLTFTLRDDGSSRFSKDNRWGLFPSVALAWRIMDEPWMKNVKTLSQLKLRLGWGITGQQNITNDDYPYLARYTGSWGTASYILGTDTLITLRPEGYDPNIKWEETTTTNIGLDFGFVNDRIYGSLDVYWRKTKDLINFIPVPAGSNLSNYITTNVGDLENKGVEFSINGKPFVGPDFYWDLGVNATYNKNKITKLTASDDPNYLGVLVGNISGGVGNTIQIHSVGYPSNSFFVYEQVYDANGKPIEGLYVDRNKDGKINDDDRYQYKKPAADVYLGINSRMQYKNWDFVFSGRANIGNYVYDNFSSNNSTYERLYRPEGPYLANVSADVAETDFKVPQYLSDYYIKNASFFKLDNIALGYTFDKLFNTGAKLRLSATVNNVFTITEYKGLDPEIFSGIDYSMYPRTRVFVLGLNLIF
ncbi:MAG: SusC/RagA family TonB-linked outer membrane protein [Bacteroidetes bacterium 38_7]|nr:MAG: SusC/RagA family TonB-linked outer membrane protein [Bacteroidetes bacterium 38_7]HAL63950.1 SusC/RagA family protein [Bacteroidales bacterium]